MLNQVKSQEILTKRAARVKYRTKYIVMIITDVVDQADNDLGYVIYVSDDERELLEISRDQFKGKTVAFTLGVAAEPHPQIGNVVYYD
jgi:hypothetical protein